MDVEDETRKINFLDWWGIHYRRDSEVQQNKSMSRG